MARSHHRTQSRVLPADDAAKTAEIGGCGQIKDRESKVWRRGGSSSGRCETWVRRVEVTYRPANIAVVSLELSHRQAGLSREATDVDKGPTARVWNSTVKFRLVILQLLACSTP